METEKRITRAHRRSIFNLLENKELLHFGFDLCMKFSNDRTGYDHELTLSEAQNLIKYIKGNSIDDLKKEFTITSLQNRTIHALLSKLCLMNSKDQLCTEFSYDRTEHTSELAQSEAEELIRYLRNNDASEVTIKRIWHLGYVSNIIYGDTKDDLAINAAKLDMFLLQRGSVKKPLRQQNIEELSKTLRQFESIASSVHEKQALNSYILHFETEIEQCIACENYEKAAKHKHAIELAKSNPKLAVSFFKKKSKKKKAKNAV